MTCELRTECQEAARHAEVSGQGVPGRGNWTCVGQESGMSLKCVRSIKASVAGGKESRSERWTRARAGSLDGFHQGSHAPGLLSGCYIEMDRREAREELDH